MPVEKPLNSIALAVAVILIIALGLYLIGLNPQTEVQKIISTQYNTLANIAEVQASEVKQLELTIYTPQESSFALESSIALIREVRSFNHQGGSSKVMFQSFPTLVIPASFTFTDLTDLGSVISEKAYSSPPKDAIELATRYEASEVTITTGNQTTTGKLITLNPLLIENSNGQVTLITTYDKITFKDNKGKTTRALEVTLTSQKTGSHDAQVLYKTSGLSWTASYNAMLTGNNLLLESEAAITNNAGGASFKDSKVNLVAASINIENRQAEQPRQFEITGKAMPAISIPETLPSQQAIGETHTYTLPSKVTLNNGETKIIPLIAQARINASSEFTFEPPSSEVNVKLTFTNSPKNNLGVPMPAGIVTVYTAAQDGTTVLAGQDSIDHTPEGQVVTLNIAKSFDVTGKREVLNATTTKCSFETKYRTTISNAKDTQVTVKVIEQSFGQLKAISSPSPIQPDQNTYAWNVNVAPKSNSTIEYTLTQNWC